MTQALNFTVKAIENFVASDLPKAPLSQIGMQYLLGKLREAQVFILPDYGMVLDRDKPRPEVPGLTFAPAFPVVALEYAAPADKAQRTPGYTDSPASRRIALAWRWSEDIPPELRRWSPADIEDGVVVASISFMDRLGFWVPVAAAAHVSFSTEWVERPAATPFYEAAVAAGRIASKVAAARTIPFTLIPLLPEMLAETRQRIGHTALMDTVGADLMDEVNAYIDVCYALSCRNVSPERHPAPEKLNKARIRRGDLPLKDFHILQVAGAVDGDHDVTGTGGSRRGHLRRGHIRQLRYLGEGRMTWVNATMVRGRGFVDKAYAV
ncbi:hypothetical protein [Sphingopyxis macrogoltabida]|uniref:Uncharacterized protein n=1 Tax=Sphingopyxis macrogoltabida TaxID=33050 RepID=A0AAC9AX63_SPHMC|nr:hypothetical protein [Sphingopyxis macrogoltabida]ALJ15337.1 hypothetical protein LH19_20880 [Sphingopyxis macrogoltabida]AMU91587.1 hypothetical protein ATM17_21465 [Sphingopyxis macrogoltabida]